MPFLYTECMSTTSDRQRGWRLLAGIINVQEYQQLFLAALGEAQAGKWPCCSTRGASAMDGAMEWGLTGRSSSCCPDKCRPSLETPPKVLAPHSVAVSHAQNFPKALAISAAVCVSLGCCLLLCWHVDKVSGYVLQPSESKPNVTPLTVLAHVLCAIKSYAHLLYVQRLIPHQVCCTIRLASCCFGCFC